MVSETRLQELRNRFRDEVVKHVEQMSELLGSMTKFDQSAAGNIANHLHAVKGSAPIMAAHPISHIARVAEECVHHLMKHPSLFSPAVATALLNSFTVMKKQAEEFAAGHGVPDSEGAIAALQTAVPTLKPDDHAHTLAGKSLSGILGPEEPGRPAGHRQRRVLFVDDSQVAREVYRIMLTRQGYIVEVAADGAEGLERLRSSRFDVVVTDDQMPEMDGIEMLRSARREEGLRETPFVVISGKANDEARETALNEGASAYLVKGNFQKEHLLEVLEEVLK